MSYCTNASLHALSTSKPASLAFRYTFGLHSRPCSLVRRANDVFLLLAVDLPRGSAFSLLASPPTHTWSINDRKYRVSELAKHLQMIIKKENGIPIPSEPPINLPQRMDLPVLGTQTSNVASLDEKRNSKESEMKTKAQRMRLERESKGEGSMYSNMQPWSKPELDELVGKRIDVLCTVELDSNEKVLKWCQGEVVKVVGENKVEVEWDPALDIEGCEESMGGEQVLLHT